MKTELLIQMDGLTKVRGGGAFVWGLLSSGCCFFLWIGWLCVRMMTSFWRNEVKCGDASFASFLLFDWLLFFKPVLQIDPSCVILNSCFRSSLIFFFASLRIDWWGSRGRRRGCLCLQHPTCPGTWTWPFCAGWKNGGRRHVCPNDPLPLTPLTMKSIH